MCNCILYKYGLGLGYKNTRGCSVRILLKKTPVYIFTTLVKLLIVKVFIIILSIAICQRRNPRHAFLGRHVKGEHVKDAA